MSKNEKTIISIIGGGPAGMLCAAFLDKEKYDITIYERNQTIGRKFLVAGKGGFNLTHGEPIDLMIQKYSPKKFLENGLNHFTNKDLQKWLLDIGIPTFIGSSNRVFPEKGIKPIQVLDAIKCCLIDAGVHIKTKMQWTGWGDKNDLIFNKEDVVKSDINIFCLGGASWKKTGSDGLWTALFASHNISIQPFIASNCAFRVDWPTNFALHYAGKPLKNISVRCDELVIKGELVITDFGLEGNAIYALSAKIQTQLAQYKEALISIDLKPSLEIGTIEDRLRQSPTSNVTSLLKSSINLNSTKIQLLKSTTSKETFQDNHLLAQAIKALPIKIEKSAAIDEAISTTGGINLAELDGHYQLKSKKNNFCIGEMTDWDAPTGGYLLQACFSMGAYLADFLNNPSNK